MKAKQALMTNISTLTSLLSLVSAVNLHAAATLTSSLPANGNLVISWNSRGALEKANRISGPWTTITNAPNPYTASITNGARSPLPPRRPITSTACASTLSPTRPPPSPCSWPRFSCWDSKNTLTGGHSVTARPPVPSRSAHQFNSSTPTPIMAPTPSCSVSLMACLVGQIPSTLTLGLRSWPRLQHRPHQRRCAIEGQLVKTQLQTRYLSSCIQFIAGARNPAPRRPSGALLA